VTAPASPGPASWRGSVSSAASSGGVFSFGVGGASIEGRVVAADGTETPVAYKWYETDLRNAYGNWVWSDATWTFDRFARRLARGGELAQR